ncbi:LysR family transcriptional regulator [Aurantiacibacter rhizosphaerae]|uniref:LysR family transcriptional regulator n=1 Tax=Aurantiacibacter rhizosphaerae TaxID=2691582 RepID=A0A844XI46_9SPHN|nr:LysR family transcriptional regulator [Aurantiacibacter rhizosphaerae]MWV29234.1 LysR family transcriptional regulator [Aurantiacibacter rhizosphaerae]
MTTTRQIEIFVTVAELESVRLAAEHLDVSQPTVSKHLKALEANIGGRLFERNRGQRVKLSPLGRQLLDDAQFSLAARHRIENATRLAVQSNNPVIYVRGFMSDWVKQQYEGLQLAGLPAGTRFKLIDDSEDPIDMVRKTPGSMSLYRSARGSRVDGLRSSILRTETLSLFAAPSVASALKSGGMLPSEVRFLDYSKRANTDFSDGRLLASAGLEQAKRVEAPQFIELVTKQVLQGNGAAVFFDWHQRAAVEAGELVRLSKDCELAHLCLIAHKSVDKASFDRVAQSFVTRLELV